LFSATNTHRTEGESPERRRKAMLGRGEAIPFDEVMEEMDALIKQKARDRPRAP
jgi:hypothetical protein